MADKPKIAFYWCSACGGCDESIVDLSEDLLELRKRVDVVFWPLAMDARQKDLEGLAEAEIDLTLINGAVGHREDAHMARLFRRKSKRLVAHGTCAHLDGIVGLGNFHTARALVSRSFEEVPSVRNHEGVLPGSVKALDDLFNVSDGMATPLAQAEFERMFDACGEKPVHHKLVYHWARLVEVLFAAERMGEIASDDQLTDPEVRNIPTQTPREGVGICEAPRGTLIHHYETDETAILKRLNLLVATQNNGGAINLSVLRAARAFIKDGCVSNSALNRVEMAYRAYDPCLACATH